MVDTGNLECGLKHGAASVPTMELAGKATTREQRRRCDSRRQLGSAACTARSTGCVPGLHNLGQNLGPRSGVSGARPPCLSTPARQLVNAPAAKPATVVSPA